MNIKMRLASWIRKASTLYLKLLIGLGLPVAALCMALPFLAIPILFLYAVAWILEDPITTRMDKLADKLAA